MLAGPDGQMLAIADGVVAKDYENLVLVGVWLAVKENGETLKNFITWV